MSNQPKKDSQIFNWADADNYILKNAPYLGPTPEMKAAFEEALGKLSVQAKKEVSTDAEAWFFLKFHGLPFAVGNDALSRSFNVWWARRGLLVRALLKEGSTIFKFGFAGFYLSVGRVFTRGSDDTWSCAQCGQAIMEDMPDLRVHGHTYAYYELLAPRIVGHLVSKHDWITEV